MSIHWLLSGGTRVVATKIIMENPTEVWKYSNYVHFGPAMFMPVQRIKNRFACCSVKFNGEEKLVVSLIPRLFY